MSLAPGTRLGAYEILSPLGAGGMGEVYRARDTRLHRTVALKVAAERFSDRMEREARAIASLNHPQICQIYDVGPDYLVMEFVDGRPLGGPVGVDEALAVAVQILDALDAAHRRGIVHRDLKPANILVSRTGIKLLDFGLAKMAAVGDLKETAFVTAEHTIVGTLAYMSPEQLQGRDADARSDLFAFGLVFYELLTGRNPFAGDTEASLIASILKDAPPPVSSVVDVADRSASALDALIDGCLAKDPEDRWQSARDLKRELQRIVRERGAVAPAAPPAVRSRERLWIAATVASTLAAVALGSVYVLKTPAPQPRVTLSLAPPEEQAAFTADANAGGTALSPDGRSLVFGAEVNGTSRLYVRQMATGETRLIPGSEGSGKPFWSPDGRSIGFFDRALKRVNVAGGEPVSLTTANPRGGAWNADGTILFTQGVSDGGMGLQRIGQDGGSPSPVTTLDLAARENAHYWPQFLRDGRHFLYLAKSPIREKNAIYVGSLDDAPLQAHRVRVVPAQYGAQYVQAPGERTGHLLYVLGSDLVAQRFDATSLKLEGDPAKIATGLTLVASNGFADFTTASDGTLVYGNRPPPLVRVIWKLRNGSDGDVVLEPSVYSSSALAPDGRSVAFGEVTAATGKAIFVQDFARRARVQLTFDEFADDPVWSPGGQQIAYDVVQQGLFTRNADGSGSRQQILKATDALRPLSWCGNTILYNQRVNDRFAVNALSRADGTTSSYLQSTGNIIHAAFSADCRWVVYDSTESGVSEIYVQSFPVGRGRWRVSNGGGSHAHWREDGREILFRTSTSLLAADVTMSADRFVVGTPQVVFDYPGASVANVSFETFDNGRRFLVPEPTKRPNLPLTVLLNWQNGLPR